MIFGFMERQLKKAISDGVRQGLNSGLGNSNIRDGVREGMREGMDGVMHSLLRRVTTNALIMATWAVCKDCKDNSPNPPTYVQSDSAGCYSGYTHLISRTQTNEWCPASEIWKLIERGAP